MPRKRRSSRSRRDLFSGDDDDRGYSRESRRDRRDDRYYREHSRDRSYSDDDCSEIGRKGSRDRRRSFSRRSLSYCSDEDWERDNRSRARNEERRLRKHGKRNKSRKKLGPSRAARMGPGGLETRRQVQRRRNNNHNTKSSMGGIDNAKLKATLEGDGLAIVDMASDGNCLFRAVSDQLYGDHGDHHDEIRSEICDFMEGNEDEFKMFLVFEGDEGKNNHDATDFESYIKDTRKDGVWGGNLELVAAARLYRRNITVYSATLDKFTIDCDHEETSGSDLLLSFHSGDHYNSVRRNAGTKKYQRSSSSRDRKSGKNGGGGNFSRPSLSETVTTSTSTLSTSATAHAAENLNSSGRQQQQQDVVVATVVNVYDVPARRDDPCPCGSGKRYKRCCPARYREEKKEERRRRDRRERYDSDDSDRRSGGVRRNYDRNEEDMVVGGFKALRI